MARGRSSDGCGSLVVRHGYVHNRQDLRRAEPVVRASSSGNESKPSDEAKDAPSDGSSSAAEDAAAPPTALRMDSQPDGENLQQDDKTPQQDDETAQQELKEAGQRVWGTAEAGVVLGCAFVSFFAIGKLADFPLLVNEVTLPAVVALPVTSVAVAFQLWYLAYRKVYACPRPQFVAFGLAVGFLIFAWFFYTPGKSFDFLV